MNEHVQFALAGLLWSLSLLSSVYAACRFVASIWESKYSRLQIEHAKRALAEDEEAGKR